MGSVEPLQPTVNDQRELRSLSLSTFKSFSAMILLLVLGALTAICQHAFYSHIEGQQPGQFFIPQVWVIRIGIALAFLFKTSLVAGICIAYHQRSWFSFQRNAITVDGIDAIFKILQDPRKFFVPEMLLRNKILALMALMSWVLPLSAIFSTASLTGTSPNDETKIVIQTPVVSNIELPVPLLGPLNGSASLYELTSSTPPTFGSPTPQLKRLALRVFTGGETVYWPSPCGIDCTYTIVFEGPAYNCVDHYDPNLLVADRHVLFSASPGLVPAPSGNNYTNFTAQNLVSDGVWLNRTIYENSTMQSTHCMLHSATYTTDVQYINNVPKLTTSVALHQQIYSSIFFDLARIFLGQLPNDNQTASFTNFYAIEQAVQALFSGYLDLSQEGGTSVAGTSEVQLWNFVTFQTNTLPVLSFPANFSEKVESLLINTTLSMLNFAQNPLPPQTGFAITRNVEAALFSPTNVTVFSNPTLYAYSPRTLWEIYGIALGISTLCITIGCFMLLKNGIDYEMSFSQVLITTRNPSLDPLCQATPEEIRKTKLRYGELIGEHHFCFGLDDEIRKR